MQKTFHFCLLKKNNCVFHHYATKQSINNQTSWYSAAKYSNCDFFRKKKKDVVLIFGHVGTREKCKILEVCKGVVTVFKIYSA